MERNFHMERKERNDATARDQDVGIAPTRFK